MCAHVANSDLRFSRYRSASHRAYPIMLTSSDECILSPVRMNAHRAFALMRYSAHTSSRPRIRTDFHPSSCFENWICDGSPQFRNTHRIARYFIQRLRAFTTRGNIESSTKLNLAHFARSDCNKLEVVKKKRAKKKCFAAINRNYTRNFHATDSL